jgi:hypothetical protein
MHKFLNKCSGNFITIMFINSIYFYAAVKICQIYKKAYKPLFLKMKYEKIWS